MAASTRVVIAHPDLTGSSRVNRRWAAELAKHPDEFDVRDLYALYPSGVLDEAGSGDGDLYRLEGSAYDAQDQC